MPLTGLALVARDRFDRVRYSFVRCSAIESMKKGRKGLHEAGFREGSAWAYEAVLG